MSDLDGRLSAIFHATFPSLSAGAARQATRDSVDDWDSIAALTLATLVEEEFGEQFDLDAAAEWTSYEQIRTALENRLDG